MSKEFKFKPADWIPFRDQEVLERCRNIRREDMEKHPNPDFKIKVVEDVTSIFIADMFSRIKESDEKDIPVSFILPNPWPAAYSNVALLCNRFNVSCRNLTTFNMDEWANEDGEVAPLSYSAGLGHSFEKYFYGTLREDLRPDMSHFHYLTTQNVYDYSNIIDDLTDGGVTMCYSATGWPGHIAFIDPDTKEFHAESLEEFLEMGSRLVTQHPLTVAENSLFSVFGSSGDVANVPPRAATIGPRDIKHAKDRFEMHSLVFLGGTETWQRMISRLTLYGPVSMQTPASIIQLFKTSVFVSEAIAKPFCCEEGKSC